MGRFPANASRQQQLRQYNLPDTATPATLSRYGRQANTFAPAGNQGGFSASPYGMGSMFTMPEQNPYTQVGAMQSQSRDLASYLDAMQNQHQTDAGLFSNLVGQPYGLANTLAQTYPGAQASQYGSLMDMIGQVMPAAYGAQTAMTTAPYGPWAQVQSARMGGLSQMDIARTMANAQIQAQQLANQGKSGNLASILGWLGTQNFGQLGGMPGGIQTNYGAGVTV